MKTRIEQVVDTAPRFDGMPPETPNPFISSPAEFLSRHIAIELRKEEVFTRIFGEYIDAYPRDDYPARALPAMRIYDKGYRKTSESHYVVGEVFIDLVLPASLRRYENQEVSDVLSSALMQQFRRPDFFSVLCDVVPGLNELGREYNVDKDLVFVWSENQVPLTQIRMNFRIDLKEWDSFLERDYRTKNDPFNRTLGDLETLAGIIEGLREDETEVELPIEQDLGE